MLLIWLIDVMKCISCIERIFADENVIPIINEKFIVERAIPITACVIKHKEVTKALRNFQKEMLEYIKCTCNITIKNVRDIIAEITKTCAKDKTLFLELNNSTDYHSLVMKEANAAYEYFLNIFNQLSKFIFLRYLDLSCDIPTFQNCFNKHFFCNLENNLNTKKNIITALKNTIDMAAKENDRLNEFKIYYNENIIVYFKKEFQTLLEKVNYMCEYLGKQINPDNIQNIRESEVIDDSRSFTYKNIDDKIMNVKSIFEEIIKLIDGFVFLIGAKKCNDFINFCENKMSWLYNNLDPKKPKINKQNIEIHLKLHNLQIKHLLLDLQISLEGITHKFLELNNYVLIYGNLLHYTSKIV